jgi:alpha-tubulin suppressor-like RCC1 family protein
LACGGLHTVALTQEGHCFAWGRGEGGQLGIPFEEMTFDQSTNEIFLMVPKRIKGLLENVNIVQVACGDAHTLALASNGSVYGWGYTNSGQLGLGYTDENADPNLGQLLQIKYPVRIDKLGSTKIVEIYAGSTFSLFLNEKRELYATGLNDYCQLALEKNIMQITNNNVTKKAVSSSK